MTSKNNKSFYPSLEKESSPLTRRYMINNPNSKSKIINKTLNSNNLISKSDNNINTEIINNNNNNNNYNNINTNNYKDIKEDNNNSNYLHKKNNSQPVTNISEMQTLKIENNNNKNNNINIGDLYINKTNKGTMKQSFPLSLNNKNKEKSINLADSSNLINNKIDKSKYPKLNETSFIPDKARLYSIKTHNNFGNKNEIALYNNNNNNNNNNNYNVRESDRSLCNLAIFNKDINSNNNYNYNYSGEKENTNNFNLFSNKTHIPYNNIDQNNQNSIMLDTINLEYNKNIDKNVKYSSKSTQPHVRFYNNISFNDDNKLISNSNVFYLDNNNKSNYNNDQANKLTNINTINNKLTDIEEKRNDKSNKRSSIIVQNNRLNEIKQKINILNNNKYKLTNNNINSINKAQNLKSDAILHNPLRNIQFLNDYNYNNNNQSNLTTPNINNESNLIINNLNSLNQLNIDRNQEKYENIVNNIHKKFKSQMNLIINDEDNDSRYNCDDSPRGFDKERSGSLINNRLSIKQLDSHFSPNTLFYDRQNVMSNMNKLDNIISNKKIKILNYEKLNKKEKLNNSCASNYNSNNKSKTTNNLNSTSNKFESILNVGKTKFIKLTMALLAGKGINTEDRIIKRGQRNEKGGVVDLTTQSANNSPSKNKKYEVKKLDKNNNKSMLNINTITNEKKYSQRQRILAVEIIQNWWKDILTRFKNFNDKIIKIQSNWRTFLVRNYYNNLKYVNYLIQQSFSHINLACKENTNRLIFKTLKNKFGKKYYARVYLTKLIKLQRFIKKYLMDKKLSPYCKLANVIVQNLLKNKKRIFNKIFDLNILRQLKCTSNKNIYKCNNDNINDLNKLKKKDECLLFIDCLKCFIYNNVLKNPLIKANERNDNNYLINMFQYSLDKIKQKALENASLQIFFPIKFKNLKEFKRSCKPLEKKQIYLIDNNTNYNKDETFNNNKNKNTDNYYDNNNLLINKISFNGNSINSLNSEHYLINKYFILYLKDFIKSISQKRLYFSKWYNVNKNISINKTNILIEKLKSIIIKNTNKHLFKIHNVKCINTYFNLWLKSLNTIKLNTLNEKFDNFKIYADEEINKNTAKLKELAKRNIKKSSILFRKIDYSRIIKAENLLTKHLVLSHLKGFNLQDDEEYDCFYTNEDYLLTNNSLFNNVKKLSKKETFNNKNLNNNNNNNNDNNNNKALAKNSLRSRKPSLIKSSYKNNLININKKINDKDDIKKLNYLKPLSFNDQLLNKAKNTTLKNIQKIKEALTKDYKLRPAYSKWKDLSMKEILNDNKDKFDKRLKNIMLKHIFDKTNKFNLKYHFKIWSKNIDNIIIKHNKSKCIINNRLFNEMLKRLFCLNLNYYFKSWREYNDYIKKRNLNVLNLINITKKIKNSQTIKRIKQINKAKLIYYLSTTALVNKIQNSFKENYKLLAKNYLNNLNSLNNNVNNENNKLKSIKKLTNNLKVKNKIYNYFDIKSLFLIWKLRSKNNVNHNSLRNIKDSLNNINHILIKKLCKNLFNKLIKRGNFNNGFYILNEYNPYLTVDNYKYFNNNFKRLNKEINFKVSKLAFKKILLKSKEKDCSKEMLRTIFLNYLNNLSNIFKNKSDDIYNISDINKFNYDKKSKINFNKPILNEKTDNINNDIDEITNKGIIARNYLYFDDLNNLKKDLNNLKKCKNTYIFLKESIIKINNKNKVLLTKTFYKYKRNINLTAIINSAVLLQKYSRILLRSLTKRQLLIGNARNIKGIIKLSKIINKLLPFNKIINKSNNIKKLNSAENIKDFMNKKLLNIVKDLDKYSIDKSNAVISAANKIQNNFRAFKSRNIFKKSQYLNNKVKQIVAYYKIYLDNKNIYKYFITWKNKIKYLDIIDKSNTIKNYYKKSKEKKNKLKKDYLNKLKSKIIDKKYLNNKINFIEELNILAKKSRYYNNFMLLIFKLKYYVLDKIVFKHIRLNKNNNDNINKLRKLVKDYYLINLFNLAKHFKHKHNVIKLIKLSFNSVEQIKINNYHLQIKKWRFYVLMKRTSKNKLEYLYKNMHLQMLNTVDNILGEKGIEKDLTALINSKYEYDRNKFINKFCSNENKIKPKIKFNIEDDKVLFSKGLKGFRELKEKVKKEQQNLLDNKLYSAFVDIEEDY